MQVLLGTFLLLYVGWGVYKHLALCRKIERRVEKGRLVPVAYTGIDAAMNVLLWDPIPRVPVCLSISYGVNLLLGGGYIPWQN